MGDPLDISELRRGYHDRIAWVALDDDGAEAVVPAAEESRLLQSRLTAALLDLDGVPMDAALDLAIAARAFERLCDHSVEIAQRVLFAVRGTPTLVTGA